MRVHWHLGQGWRAAAGLAVAGTLMVAGAGAVSPAGAAAGVSAGVPAGVSAWGDNSAGELGDGSLAQAHVPGSVAGLAASAVSAGARFNLALRSDGTVMAWGDNQFGELGDGTTVSRARPVPVRGLTGVTAVSAGGGHGLALLADGTVMAWGDNQFGELGDGTTVSRATPVPVRGLTGVTAISAGELHSLAVLADGTVMAWGDNSNGQLGDATFTNSAVPVAVRGLAGAAAVSAGGLFSLALLGDGTVRAWGSNIIGQLGTGSMALASDVPVRVRRLSGVQQISAGFFHALALRAGGTVAAWGDNAFGQLGNPSAPGGQGSLPVPVTGITGAASVSAGGLFSMAVVAGGKVMGFGDGAQGQLGDGTTSDHPVPVRVSGLAGVSMVSAGASHALAATGQGGAPAGSTGLPSVWHAVRTPDPGAPPPPGLSDIGFTGASAAAADDVWAVGINGLTSSPSRGFAEHWNGTTWRPAAVPAPGGRQTTLRGVIDLGAAGAWAVGRSFGTPGSAPSRTLIEHWNGHQWAITASPNPAGGPNGVDQLEAITGTGPGDLWAAGEAFTGPSGDIHLLFEHFDGTTWTAVTTQIPGFARSVAAASPRDVWAVGINPDGSHCSAGMLACTNTVAAHFDGHTWTTVPTPDLITGPNAQNFLTGISVVAAGDAWASGYEESDGPSGIHNIPYLLHFNGTAWSLVKAPNTGTEGSQLRAVTAPAATDVWAVGETDDTDGALRTITEHYNGTAWSISPSVDPGESGPLADNTLQTVTSAGTGHTWALGAQDTLGHCCQQTLALTTTTSGSGR